MHARLCRSGSGVFNTSRTVLTPPSHSSFESNMDPTLTGRAVGASIRQGNVGNMSNNDVTSSIEKNQAQLLNEERDHAIKYKTCSWQKTAALLFSEYICLAVLSFPWSYSVLGLLPGIILTVSVAAIVLYTSLILWSFCLKHPQIRDVCDVGRILFGGSNLAYNVTALFFILNNTFIQALHVVVGAELINTLSSSAACTVLFSAVTALACFFVSLPRTLDQLSWLGSLSAAFTGLAILLAIIFAGIQDHPFGYVPGQEPIVTAFPVIGTTFVSGKCMSAFLNITYILVGQITLPSFIAEMKDPREFPKALWAVTAAEIVVFSVCGSLQTTYQKIVFSFLTPTILFLGALYSSITSRFIFLRVLHGLYHCYSNTLTSWSIWVAIVAATWCLAFVIAEVIPFFSDMLSLMSSLFGDFIFWPMAYLQLYPKGMARWNSPMRTMETIFNYFLVLLGFYVLIVGTYISVDSIILSYQASQFSSTFSCASTSL
ncbi:transmembrane amino acid transporter protein-domain-containing protein [Phlebopus sp. FC_14]|nr:transmembrane amino acid transporter protein-domain-containing protein [Phlebopus sp. FC_14]